MIAPLPADWDASDLAFHFSSSRPCLDFVATLAERHGRAIDRWRSVDDLARWFDEADIAGGLTGLDEGDLRVAVDLREAIWRLVTDRLAGRAPHGDDVATVNRHAAPPTPAPRLADGGDAASWWAASPFDAALSEIARDAIDLVTGTDLERIRECEESSCSVLFVDTSRPGNRRWCSMNRCGNRAKKAAYRKRHGA